MDSKPSDSACFCACLAALGSTPINAIHYSEVNLTGSQNASPQQYRRALKLLSHLPEIDTVTSHRFPLADATNAYEVRLRNEGLKSMILVSEDATPAQGR